MSSAPTRIVRNDKPGPQSEPYTPKSPPVASVSPSPQATDFNKQPAAKQPAAITKVCAEAEASLNRFMNAQFKILYERFMRHDGIVRGFEHVDKLALEVKRLQSVLDELAKRKAGSETELAQRKAALTALDTELAQHKAALDAELAKRKAALTALDTELAQRKAAAEKELAGIVKKKELAEAGLSTAVQQKKELKAAQDAELAQRKAKAEKELAQRKAKAEKELAERKAKAEKELAEIIKKKKAAADPAADLAAAAADAAAQRVIEAQKPIKLAKRKPEDKVAGKKPKRQKTERVTEAVETFNKLTKSENAIITAFMKEVFVPVITGETTIPAAGLKAKVSERGKEWVGKDKKKLKCISVIWKTVLNLAKYATALREPCAHLVQ